MRVVLDTNVLLSGMFTRGLCEALLELAVTSESCRLVLSDHILGEFAHHAVDKFGAPKQQVKEAVEFFRAHAEVVAPTLLPQSVCEDPDDVPVLGTAVAGGADVLVTGDRHLLDIRKIGQCLILSPRELFEKMR